MQIYQLQFSSNEAFLSAFARNDFGEDHIFDSTERAYPTEDVMLEICLPDLPRPAIVRARALTQWPGLGAWLAVGPSKSFDVAVATASGVVPLNVIVE